MELHSIIFGDCSLTGKRSDVWDNSDILGCPLSTTLSSLLGKIVFSEPLVPLCLAVEVTI